jgi:hypothetical protein
MSVEQGLSTVCEIGVMACLSLVMYFGIEVLVALILGGP